MKRMLLMLCLLFGLLTNPAHATITTATLADFQGPLIFGGTFPIDHTVGTFSYTLPANEALISATLSGVFGVNPNFSTAPVDVFFDSLLVAQCGLADPCTQSGSMVPWSHTFMPGTFSLLLDGEGTLTASQLAPIAVALSSMKLTMETVLSDPGQPGGGDPPGGGNPIPEPSTLLLISTGILGLVTRRYAKKSHV